MDSKFSIFGTGRGGRQSRLDLSDDFVHFTPSQNDLFSMLDEGFIRPNAIAGYLVATVGRARQTERLRSACFGECIRSGNAIKELSLQHGSFGLEFSGSFLQANGGNPAWEVGSSTEVGRFISELRHNRLFTEDLEHPMWGLAPFIDMPSANFNFRWERSLRVPGGLRFGLSDLKRIHIVVHDGPRSPSVEESESITQMIRDRYPRDLVVDIYVLSTESEGGQLHG
jgi:hypothetical protein